MQRTPRTCLLVVSLVTLELALLSSSSAADFSSTWLNGTGNWSDATQWNTSPNYPNNGNGVTYDATINSGAVTLDRDITIQRLTFSGGSLTGSSDLTLNEGLTWTGGELRTSGAINLGAGSTSTISGSDLVLDGPTINNSGTVNQNSDLSSSNPQSEAVINNLAGAAWNVQGSFNAVVASFNNSGTVTVQSPSSSDPSTSFYLMGGGTSNGTFIVETNSKLTFFPNIGAQTENTYTLNGATISGAGVTENFTSLVVAGNGTINTTFFNEGNLTVQAGATLTLTGFYKGFDRGGIALAGGTVTSAQLLIVGENSDLSGFWDGQCER